MQKGTIAMLAGFVVIAIYAIIQIIAVKLVEGEGWKAKDRDIEVEPPTPPQGGTGETDKTKRSKEMSKGEHNNLYHMRSKKNSEDEKTFNKIDDNAWQFRDEEGRVIQIIASSSVAKRYNIECVDGEIGYIDTWIDKVRLKEIVSIDLYNKIAEFIRQEIK